MALGWRGQYLRYQELLLNIVNIYRQKPEVKVFLETLLSLATISFFGLFALKPTLVTITQLIKEVQTKEQTLATMNKKIQNINTAQTYFFQQTSLIDIVKSAIPETPEPQNFIRQIEGIAAKNQVDVLGISLGGVTLIGKTAEKPNKEETALPTDASGLSYSISITGTNYQPLYSFLTDFEKMRRPIKIDTLSISIKENESGKSIIMVVSGRTVYLAN